MSQKLTLHPCNLQAGCTVPLLLYTATHYISDITYNSARKSHVFLPSPFIADRPEDAGLDDGAAVLCAEAERALRPLQLPRRLPRRRGRLHRERGLRRRQGQRRSVMNADQL